MGGGLWMEGRVCLDGAWGGGLVSGGGAALDGGGVLVDGGGGLVDGGLWMEG